MPIGGLLERKHGARRTSVLGGCAVVAGHLLAWPAIDAASLSLLYLSAGALFGAGIGLCYNSPIVCCYRWLPHHRGFVSGVVVAGYGGAVL